MSNADTVAKDREAFAFLAELCSIHSPGGAEASLVPAIHARLERMRGSIRVETLSEGRVNILAFWGTPKVLLSTHLDVVEPRLRTHVTADAVYGRGACDAKAQIAAQIRAIEGILESGRTDIAWLGVSGEETDAIGARESLKLAPLFSECNALVIGEPTESKLATGQRGFKSLRLSCQGVEAHGAMPYLGQNAIIDLIDWISAINRTLRVAHPVYGEEGINVGEIRGGTAPNVVPSSAEANVVVRTIPGGRLLDAIESSRPYHGHVEVVVDEPWDEFSTPEGFPTCHVPFGSDAPVMRALIPSRRVVVGGPGNPEVAHTVNEKITLPEFQAGINLFRGLALHYMEA